MKTTEQIFNEIIAEKTSGMYAELDELNSTSKVSIWRLNAWIFAFFSKAINELFESFQIYIESVFAKNQHGTLTWWITELKKFQYNDQLEFIGGVFKYALIDVSKQIIKQVAVETLNKVLVFKVVKINSSGILTPLSGAELVSFLNYCNRIKFPGTFIQAISTPADNLKLSFKIYYDALLDKSAIEKEIRTTVESYVKNIVFNGKFIPTKLVDEIQKITGVDIPIYISGFHKNYSENSYTPINDYFTAAAGYAEITELNLQFEPNV